MSRPESAPESTPASPTELFELFELFVLFVLFELFTLLSPGPLHAASEREAMRASERVKDTFILRGILRKIVDMAEN